MGKEKHKLGENDISKTKIEGYVKNRDDLVFLEIGGKCINSAEIWEKVQMNFKSMMPLITFIIIIIGLPPMEHSHFLIHEASSPQTAVGPETSVAARRTFGHSSEENSSAGSFPQPLARQAWGRCLAVSMKTIYSALAALHPAGFLFGLSPIAPVFSRGNPLGSGAQAYWLVACTRQGTSPS